MIVTCPSSTPTLKNSSALMKCAGGMPTSFNALAKPIPCTKPKRKIMMSLQALIRWWKRFSIAANNMERAIKGSMICGLGMIYPAAASPSVNECATVNIEHCIITDFTFELRKKMLRIKRIWSNPSGITWVYPIQRCCLAMSKSSLDTITVLSVCIVIPASLILWANIHRPVDMQNPVPECQCR